MTTRDITQTLREYAESVDKDRGHNRSLLTKTMRDAATVIDEQDREIFRLQQLLDELNEVIWSGRREPTHQQTDEFVIDNSNLDAVKQAIASGNAYILDDDGQRVPFVEVARAHTPTPEVP